jgi:hypothetical protein
LEGTDEPDLLRQLTPRKFEELRLLTDLEFV